MSINNNDDHDHNHHHINNDLPDSDDDCEGQVDTSIDSLNPLVFEGGFNVKEFLRLLFHKVDKVQGKDLSSNDFTQYYINLITSTASNLLNYVLKTTKINGKALTGDITLNKADIGLQYVDNTNDWGKPLSQASINALAGKEPTLTKGNLTEETSSILDISGGLGAVIGDGVTLQVKKASHNQSGYLSAEDWITFNTTSQVVSHREMFITEANQNSITLQYTPSPNKEIIHINGLVAYPGTGFDYTIVDNLITFEYALEEGEEIMAVYS